MIEVLGFLFSVFNLLESDCVRLLKCHSLSIAKTRSGRRERGYAEDSEISFIPVVGYRNRLHFSEDSNGMARRSSLLARSCKTLFEDVLNLDPSLEVVQEDDLSDCRVGDETTFQRKYGHGD